MAKQTIVRLVDDIDGSGADETVRFVWMGAEYEIDLSAKHARAFDAAIEPYAKAAKRVGSARKTGSTRKTGAAKAVATAKADLSAVREWASKNGHKVANRGRISAVVVEAYHEAQQAVAAGRPSLKPARKVTARKAPAKKATARKAAVKKTPARKVAAKAPSRG